MTKGGNRRWGSEGGVRDVVDKRDKAISPNYVMQPITYVLADYRVTAFGC